MSSEERGDEIDEPVEDEEPREEEMPPPPGRQIAIARDRCPGRKAARFVTSGRVPGGAEQSRRFHLISGDRCHPGWLSVVAVPVHRQPGIVETRGVPP